MTKAEICETTSAREEALVQPLQETPTLLDDATLERVSGGLFVGSGQECGKGLPAA